MDESVSNKNEQKGSIIKIKILQIQFVLLTYDSKYAKKT